MLNENTVTKLREMKLKGMADAMSTQMDDGGFEQMPFEDRFGLIVDAEYTKRQNNRMARLIKEAGYAVSGASVEDIEYHEERKLNGNLIKRLSTCNYIHEKQNIILLGPAGSGKTFIANALGMAASRSRLPVKYVKLPDLLGELAIADGDGKYKKLIRQYARVKLLILDEWLLFPLSQGEAKYLYDLIDLRQYTGSTILCSQFEISGWHAKIGVTAVADSICDRIVHNAHKITIGGRDSMRKRKGLSENANAASQ
jgi:DNA replication protein DnaC